MNLNFLFNALMYLLFLFGGIALVVVGYAILFGGTELEGWRIYLFGPLSLAGAVAFFALSFRAFNGEL